MGNVRLLTAVHAQPHATADALVDSVSIDAGAVCLGRPLTPRSIVVANSAAALTAFGIEAGAAFTEVISGRARPMFERRNALSVRAGAVVVMHAINRFLVRLVNRVKHRCRRHAGV